MLNAQLFDDFKGAPTLLIWGDTDDMVGFRHALAGLVRPGDIATIGSGGSSLDIMLVGGSGCSHVRVTPKLVWECSAEIVREAAERAEGLTRAGHHYLDAEGAAEDVMISAGEYPEDSFGD